MLDAYICDYIRTPIARFGGALSLIRPDDLGAIPLRTLADRNPNLKLGAIDEVIFGCANQAGEDNRNVARMSLLLAGYPETVPGVTVNRLCGSGMEAVITAARAIQSGQADLIIAGGVESMSRAPFVMPKAEAPFARKAEIYDTTIGWRFINPAMRALHGVDSMPETAENVAADFNISRADQDAFALRSQMRAEHARANGRLAQEIVPVPVRGPGKSDVIFAEDEHPRAHTNADALARLRGIVTPAGTVTAGNSSGVNDGAAALIVASGAAIAQHGLTPIARILGGATAGLAPRIMGYGPVPACRKLMARLGFSIRDFNVFEFNEAFASQCLATLRDLGLADDDVRVNPNGGAIALGHPLGMSGVRLVGTAALQLSQGQRGLAAMCIGVGQGIAVALEQVQPPPVS